MAKKGEKKGAKKDSCEFGEEYQSNKLGTALIDGETFYSKEVQYCEVDGYAIFEGDIVLGTVEEVERCTELRRAEIRGEIAAGVVVLASKRWPNCIVPYTIDSGLTNQARVTDAIAHWEANTRVRFVLRTAANQAMYPDYVDFRPGAGCRAHVGRIGGYQFVELGGSCTTGNTIHEIGHTVGLWHEQSRADRNAFVTINWAKIRPGREGNFSQHIADGDDVGVYDYGSIMHYPRVAFSTDGSETITPTNPAAVIGQRNGLSAGDIAAANSMCPRPICPPGPVTLRCPPAPVTLRCPPAPRVLACPPAPRRLCPPAPRIACPPAPRRFCPPAPRIACPPAPRRFCPPAPRIACPPAPRRFCPPAPRIACPPAPRIACPPAPRRLCPPAPTRLCPPSPRVSCPPAPRIACPPAPTGCWAGPYLRPRRPGRFVNPRRFTSRDADYDYYEDYEYEDGYGYEDSYGEGYSDYEGGCGCDCSCGCCEGGDDQGYGQDYDSQDQYADWTASEYEDPYDDCGCDGGSDDDGFDPSCEG